MSRRLDVRDARGRADGVQVAAAAVRRGEIVVIPTDTVYGVGADAFDRAAVAAVLAAKGRGREAPPPVLVSGPRVLDGLAYDVPRAALDLIDAFWPGGLTLVCRSQPSLDWDLGDTGGTVAVRMPLHRTALALLEETGPMAVTSANLTGRPPAQICDEAEAQLGEKVSVYLDGGRCPGGVASTIVDVAHGRPRVLRVGALAVERLRAVVPNLLDIGEVEGPDKADAPGGAERPDEPERPDQAERPDEPEAGAG